MPSKRKINAKPKAAKPETTAKPAGKTPETAKPETTAKPAESVLHSEARKAAAAAVSAFYAGASKPFKSAYGKFSPVNFDNAKAPSERQAALLLAMLTYSGGNIRRDGSFIRGQFRVPGTLLGYKANTPDGERLHLAQPESGCLGNQIGRTLTYIAGPLAGKTANTAIFRLNFDIARREIQATFGDKAAALCDPKAHSGEPHKAE